MRKLWSMTKSYGDGDYSIVLAILHNDRLCTRICCYDFYLCLQTMYSKHSCYLIQTIWEDPINDLNAFRKLAQSSLQAQVPRQDFSTIDN